MNTRKSCLSLSFSHGELKLILEPGKNKYLTMVKGLTEKEAESMSIEAWAHSLVLSVAKAYYKK